MVDIHARIAGLPLEKRKLLELLLDAKGEPENGQQIVRRDDLSKLTISFAQQRLWFLDQLEPGSAFYNLPVALQLTGKLNIQALKRTLDEIAKRHEVLRTGFINLDGRPEPVIADETSIELPLIELSSLPETEREARVHQLALEESHRPFNLSQIPLLRAKLLRLSEMEHVLLFTMHHIVSDAWSIGVLFKEVATLYEACRNGQPSPLADLDIQYADYAHWQRQWLQGEVLETQLAYWRAQLAGAPALLHLPTDRARPAVQSFQGARQALRFEAHTTQALKQLSRREGVTLFMTLLATFQTLLYRYSGEAEISVGSPIAGRQRRELEPLIGFFVNTLVLRISLSGEPTFRQLLGRVREMALGAYAHQDVPFEQLVEVLQPERELSHAPLFQVMFVLENTTPGKLELHELAIEPFEVDSRVAKFDLLLFLEERETDITGWLEYNTDLFEPATIERMSEHFQNLLNSITVDARQRLWELALLSEAERQQVLITWNQTATTYPDQQTLPHLFEQQAARTPTAIAVVAGQDQLSYRELNERANQVAHHLRRLGVGAEVTVGVSLERSAELVVGLLGVLKAGGAYVPLDPSYPRQRLSFMLEDAGAMVVLTQQRLASNLADEQARLICVDVERREIERESIENPCHGVTADNLAYVIYTSGSTGRPKGVGITHRSASALMYWARDVFTPQQLTGVLASTSICFDLSVFELFAPLCWGGAVILAEDALHLASLPAADQITLINTVPSAMAELVNQRQVPPSVRTVNLAGEPLAGSLVQRIYEQPTIVQVFNLYGPSEDTTYSTFALMEKGTNESPSIGRPVTNTKAYVLDQYLQPVAIGIPGDLYLSGDGLARGYVNRPEQTAERFIPHPFSSEPGARLYKTGDVARYRPDGRMDFLGRSDQQVKLRGFRIELGEVAAALAGHEAVREAMVVVREDVPGDMRLVAYFVPKPEQAASLSELRSHLREKLPDYMMPSAFVQLNAMPLTANGKINRRALPAPEQTQLETEKGFVAPRNQVEELLVRLWSDLLRVEKVGVNDNFFEAGGHSLLATQVVSRMREIFKVEVPLRSLFEYPTVAELAQQIELKAGAETLSLPLVPVPREGVLPLSFAQQRLWFLDQLRPGSAAYNMPAASFLLGPLNMAALEQSLNEVIRRHETLRSTFHAVNGQPVQVIGWPPPCALPLINLNTLPRKEREPEARRLINEWSQQPFDLAQGPLLCAKLLRLEDERHILFVNIHHIVSDGWSIGVFLREAAAFYDALANGQLPSVPALPIQYADFAHWQRQWLQGDMLESQLAYWRPQLAGAPDALSLPADHPPPPVQSFRGAHESIKLSPRLSEELSRLSGSEGMTLFMTLLAAFQILLQRYTQQGDILVGTPIANRNRTEIEGLIGFFVNTLVLRTNFSGDPSCRQLLHRVREVALGAYAHQDVPFERLVEELQPERDLSRNPLCQVLFALQRDPLQTVELQTLMLRPMEFESGATRFDLEFHLWEYPEGLQGSLIYSTDRFESATARRLLGHYQQLLEGIVAHPDERCSTLPLLTESERHQILVEWNNTAVDYMDDLRIHQLFEQQVWRTPDNLALVCDGQQLSYRELNARANQLAHYLREQGVRPDVMVGLCLERSVELVIGLLGILKAGGAYVPLDPAYPQERLSFMLDDTQSPVLLTQQSLSVSLTTDHRRIICLDADWNVISEKSDENLSNLTSGENLAYVIYTSGSTGRPKGISLSDRALRNLLEWHFTNLSTPARMVQFASISFDASFHEIFATWCTGGTLFMISEALRLDAAGLARFLFEMRIEKVILPVVVLQQLAEVFCAQEQLPGDLKEIISTGEQLQINSSVINLFKLLSNCSLHNHYGPSETHVVTALNLGNAPDEWSSHPSAGRPINNTQIYLLDRNLQVVPVGVPGELYIGGVSLARGYLNRPDLTAEKFIPDLFAKNPGGQLYKTGDLARYLPDGNIEYLGRIDNQVKIRGHRVELGEIEAALEAHPSVKEVVVLARESQPGGRRLVAYLVTHQAPAPTTSELRNFLKETLPEYMLPSAFVMLEALPLTSNGKVDRQALPLPDQRRTELSGAYLAPRTPAEELLAGIWAQVLDVEEVGVHDQFFELGGHSLLATQVISRVREAFQLELPLRLLFESPTLSGLAAGLEAFRKEGLGLNAPPIKPVLRDNAGAPLSLAQQPLWLADQMNQGNPAYNLFVALLLTGELNASALEQTLNEIVCRHEALRTTFSVRHGYPVQLIADKLFIPLVPVDLHACTPSEREVQIGQSIREEAHHSFDLSRGPLLRAKLLRLNETEHVLFFTMHHIVSDGWSMGVLVREVATLYEAFRHGQPSPLAELDIQYADYAHWQRQWLQGEVLETQLAYWREQLAGAPALLHLPTDRARPAVQSFRGARQALRFDAHTTQALKQLSGREGVTLFMTLLAAFQTLLHYYTQRDDLVVGTDVAGRHRQETEGLIGFFVNQLALRTSLAGNPTFRELLGRVREVALGAYAHQEVPFEKVVEVVKAEREASYAPLFQVKLVLQNAPLPELVLPGLTLSPYPFEVTLTKLDLIMFVDQTTPEISGTLEYNIDLFDAPTMTRLRDLYELLLRNVLQHPDISLQELEELLGEAESSSLNAESKALEATHFSMFKNIKPKPITIGPETLIKRGARE